MTTVAYSAMESSLNSQQPNAEAEQQREATSVAGAEADRAVRQARFSGVDGEILENLRAHVDLVRASRAGESLSSAQWSRFERVAKQQIQEALRPFGYYQPQITVTPTDEQITYVISLGPAVRIQQLNVEVRGAAEQHPAFVTWKSELPFKEGEVLNQRRYENAKKSLLALTLRYGFFAADLATHQILINEDKTSAKVSLLLDSGPRYSFGEVSLDWSQTSRRVRERILQPHFSFVAGDPYDSDKLATTQASLQGTPYFSNVEMHTGEFDDNAHTVPIKVAFWANKRHAYNFAVGAGTDTGPRASAGYENRRLNASGHNLNLRIGTSDVRRTAIANYRVPLSTAARDSLNFFASVEDEDNDFRTYTLSKIGAELARQWRESTLNFGLQAIREEFFVGTVEQTSYLVLPSVGWEKIVSDDPYFPTRGWSADVTLRGASESLGSDVGLLQLVADGKTVFPLGKGRVLARVRAATTDIDEALELPSSLGFLTGGDRSVRGYRYESIGVPLESTSGRSIAADSTAQDLTVGKHLLVGSLEYEHPLRKQFGAAVFIDAGDAFNNSLDLKRGAGMGLRWRLPFGALKLDVASALDRDGDPLRLHLSFGSDL